LRTRTHGDGHRPKERPDKHASNCRSDFVFKLVAVNAINPERNTQVVKRAAVVFDAKIEKTLNSFMKSEFRLNNHKY
jgi:hypothetical protein